MFTFGSLAVECDRFADVFPIQRQGTVFSLSLSCNTKPHKNLYNADTAVGKVQAQKLPKHVIYCLLRTPVNVWLSQTGALIYKHLP